MIREVKFESQDRRIKQILAALNANGIKDIEEANAICESYGLDPYKTCEETQPICFENAKWAYVVGAAIALKKGCKNAADAAEAIGIGLQSFCIPGSVADDRKVGLGHGNLAARLLREETKCFAFLAGHESFAAAEGAIKIAAVLVNPSSVLTKFCPRETSLLDSMATIVAESSLSTLSCWQRSKRLSTHMVYSSASSVTCSRRQLRQLVLLVRYCSRISRAVLTT
jgi:hypothetical protein